MVSGKDTSQTTCECRLACTDLKASQLMIFPQNCLSNCQQLSGHYITSFVHSWDQLVCGMIWVIYVMAAHVGYVLTAAHVNGKKLGSLSMWP